MDDAVGSGSPTTVGATPEAAARSNDMSRTATEPVPPSVVAAAHDGPHLGPYPVRLPKLRDPRLHVASVTITLQILGQTVFDFNLSIAQILLSIGTCALIELVIVFRRTKVIAWPASAMLTGNGIALILRVPGTEPGDWWSLHGWWVFVGCALLAMATKYLIRVDGRHIFNPSNVALVAVFLVLGEARADPQVLWWGPLSAGLVLAFAVILTGSVMITRRVGQGPTALSFLVVFGIGAGIIASSGHSITASWHLGPIEGWSYWWLVVTSPEVLVFIFFMITDPRTSPGGRTGRVVYGASIGVLSALIISTQTGEFGTKVGILAGLVIVCAFVRLIDRWTPAPGTAEDSLRQWAPTLFVPSVGDGPARRRPVGVVAVAVLVGSAVAMALFAQGSDDGAGDLDLGRRDEVVFDASTLPTVEVDNSLEMTSIELTPAMAESMGRDVVHGLAIEAAALQSGDVELAAAALSGVRLAQAADAIEAAGGPPVETPEHDVDTITATMIRTDAGPQAPPVLAVEVTGTVVTPSGSEPFEATYTLTPVRGTHLINNEYDASGNAVGDQRAGSSDAVEAAIAPSSPEPTAAELAGLSFRDVTDEVGLATARSATAVREGPAAMSGGVAVGDVTGNGQLDVFLTRVGQPNALYLNEGGVFSDATGAAGLLGEPGDEGSTAAQFVDLDGDGHLDLVVLGLGSTPNRLYRNEGDGTFVDVSEQWGLPSDPPSGPDAGSFGLAAGDYDGDGLIDLVVVDADPTAIRSALERNEVAGGDPCAPAAADARSDAAGASRTRLLRNTGNGFEDRTGDLGIDTGSVIAMTPQFADLNGNGVQDLLITGAACTTVVLHNQGDGTFVDRTDRAGLAGVEVASGSELFDANGDGQLDWFISGVSYPTASGECPLDDPMLGCSGNRLLINNGDGTFTDATDDHGVADAAWAWGAAAADLTGSGREDLVVATGHRTVATERAATRDDGRFWERSADTAERIWLNTGDGPWPDAAGPVGVEALTSAKAVVAFDADRSGRIDLLVVTTDGEPVLYRNETPSPGGWATVALDDTSSANRQGIGATLTAELADGTRSIRRVTTTGSFQSGRPAEAHFGLGSHDRIERLTVRWPDGTEQVIDDVAANRPVEVRRDEGRA